MSSFEKSDKGLEKGTGDEYQYEQPIEESASQAVVTAVAEATGRPVVPYENTDDNDGTNALPPLYEVINPEALDAIVTGEKNNGEDCLVTFAYSDYMVTVEKQTVTVTSAI